ncbi:hypothetical protein KBC75_01760 [Candidatus Shapirobacteria bacterium]|nr:hypothetical protein [Candidatus Shapirobacteria bacterium]
MINKNKLVLATVSAISTVALGVGINILYRNSVNLDDQTVTPIKETGSLPTDTPTETPIARATQTRAIYSPTPEIEMENVGVLSTEYFELEFYDTFPSCNWKGVCGLQNEFYSGEVNKIGGYLDNPKFKFDENGGMVTIGDADYEVTWENGIPKYVIVRDKTDNNKSYVAMLQVPLDVKVTIPGSNP